MFAATERAAGKLTDAPTYLANEAEGEYDCKPAIGPCEAVDGFTGYAVHIWRGRPLCAFHTPFDVV